MIILRKLRTLRSLGGEGTRLATEALLLTVFVEAGFRSLGVSRTQAWLRNWASRGEKRQPPQDLQAAIQNVRRAQRIVRRNGRLHGTCLSRSLVLWALLLRRGVETDLRVGFRGREEMLEGHAWIEHNGIPLNEDPAVVQTYSASGKSTDFDLLIRGKFQD